MGHIGLTKDKYRTFSDQISVHFGPKSDLKKSHICQILGDLLIKVATLPQVCQILRFKDHFSVLYALVSQNGLKTDII